jgi:hypothetical protein
MKRRAANLRTLARRQRWLIWLLAAYVVSLILFFCPFFAPRRAGGLPPLPQLMIFAELAIMAAVLVYLAVCLLLIPAVVLVLIAQGNHPLMVVACGVLGVLVLVGGGYLLGTFCNLLLLLSVNISVTRTLRRAGLRAGFWGMKDEDVKRVLDPTLCRGCDYNLTGNISGICPECGRPLDLDQRGA